MESLEENGYADVYERNLIDEALALLDANLPTPFTDMLIEKDAPIMVKTPGGWEVQGLLEYPSLDDIERTLYSIDNNWEANIDKFGAINRPLNTEKWRLRINAYKAFAGDKLMMSIRRLPRKQPTLKEIGLPESVRMMIEAPRGLVLVNGATGNGKSTTVSALVDCINESRNNHIITIEDPIEYLYSRKKAIFSQREVGLDCNSFVDGIRDAMRQCPNVIVIGEIRDRDTAEAALLASDSGHLVIATLHANSAPGAVQKLLSFFSSHERDAKVQSLAANLLGVISQILLPLADKSGYALASELLFNHKQQCAQVMGDFERLATWIERKDDKLSRPMADSLYDLVVGKKISKSDALRAISMGQQSLYDRLKSVAG